MSAVKAIGTIVIGVIRADAGDYVGGGAMIVGGAMELYGNNTGNTDVANAGSVVSLAGSLYTTTVGTDAIATQTAAEGQVAASSTPSVASATIPTEVAPVTPAASASPPVPASTSPITGTNTYDLSNTPAPSSGTSADALAQPGASPVVNSATNAALTPAPSTGALGSGAPIPATSGAQGFTVSAADQSSYAKYLDSLKTTDSWMSNPVVIAGAIGGVGNAIGGMATADANNKAAAERLAFDQQQAAYAHQAANAPMSIGTYQPVAPVAGVRAVAAHTNVAPVNAVPNPVVA